MPVLGKTKVLHWTYHARDKMRFYRLSESRVRRVLHSPRRTEEGVAPKTIAVMQPSSLKRSARGKEEWKQEIWAMVQDVGGKRKIISAWRYPGVTKARSEVSMGLMRKAYEEYTSNEKHS